MNTQHNTPDWFTAEAVLADPEGFGKAISSALHNLNTDASAVNQLFTYQRTLEAVTTLDATRKLQKAIRDIYPDATGITWDMYSTNRQGDFSVTFKSIQLADGSSVDEDSFYDIEDEEEEVIASTKFGRAEDAFLQYIYNFDTPSLQDEHIDFTK